MFKGFNTADATNTISLLCGFLVIFSGVYLLNLSRKDPDTLLGSAHRNGSIGGFEDSAIPTDALTAFATRRSMQARRESGEGGSNRHSRNHSWGSTGFAAAGRRSRELLMHDFALHELAEDTEDEDHTLPNGNGRRKKQAPSDEELGLGAGMRIPSTHSVPRLSGSGRTRVDKDLQKDPASR